MHNPTGFNFSRDFSTNLSLQSKTDIKAMLSTFSCPIIMDEQVRNLHAELVSLPFEPMLLLLPAGESTKTPDTVKLIYDFLAECKAGRETDIFVIGGGTITDAAAFAVSTFKRGCSLTLIPSTLLGMIDAALGGKTAVNYPSAKNLIGTFYPAAQVIIAPEFLATLPKTEVMNGLSEMLKLKFIVPALPEPIKPGDTLPEPETIFAYANAKLNICNQDLDDKGIRRLLNLGHTFGHCLESYTDYATPHGYAVVWGIAVAARISKKLNLIDSKICQQIIARLTQSGFEPDLYSSVKIGLTAAFPTLVSYDKKSEQNHLTLILFTGTGQVEIRKDFSLELITSILQDCI